MSPQDRYDLAVSAIAEFLMTADDRPGREDLVTVGARAITRDVTVRLKLEGYDCNRPADGQEPNMANFCVFWWQLFGHVGSHENGIVETIALSQILPRLKPVHRDVILALARHGTYDKAAASLGRPRSTFVTYLWAARKEFLKLWHEDEVASRIWGHDFFGIEGYDHTDAITVRTLRQRKRKKRAKGNGYPGNT
jgi:hypothetical protein